MSDFLPFSCPAMDTEELTAVKTVLDFGWITTNPKAQKLEAKFCWLTSNQYAIAVSSTTADMHIALMALGIGEGDEVITPPMTWVSTLNMIVLLGVNPIIVDVDRDTLMVTPEHIEATITPRTKEIIPEYYTGAPADLDTIYALGERYGITVIEDAAHVIVTAYKGRHIDIRGTAIFSFHVIKNITCAEGGIVVTDQFVDKLRSLKFHRIGVDAWNRQSGGCTPQAEVLAPCYKYNLPDLNAAIVLAQLQKLNELNIHRTAIVTQYQQALANLPFQPLSLPPWKHIHAWHLFIIRVDEAQCGITRNALMASLKTKGISTGLHFRAAHTRKYYRECFPTLTLPTTKWNNKLICSLPLFPDMTESDLDRIITALHQIAGQ